MSEQQVEIDRRFLIVGVMRTVVVLVILAFAYSAVPFGSPANAWVAIALGGLGLVAFGWIFLWQLRRVARSPRPILASIDALVMIIGAFVIFFSLIYTGIDSLAPGSFTEDLSRLSAAYFTMTVLATVGFGDITPVSDTARAVVMVQMGLGLGLVAATLRLVTGAARKSVTRRQSTDS